MSTSQANQWRAECDVALIVALSEEMRGVNIFHDSDPEPIHNDLGLDVRGRIILTATERKVSVLTLTIHDQGPSAAAIVTTQFLQRVGTKLLVLLGISGRISDDCKLGDVILASACDDSLYRAKIKTSGVLPGGKERSIDVLAKLLFQALGDSPPFYAYDDIAPNVLADLQKKAI